MYADSMPENYTSPLSLQKGLTNTETKHYCKKLYYPKARSPSIALIIAQNKIPLKGFMHVQSAATN